MQITKCCLQCVWFVLTVILMIWLSACLLLMFVPEQTLQRYEVSSAWLNRHYHQNKPSGTVAFRAGNTRYSHYRDRLFREHQAIAKISQPPVGAVLIEDRHWVAFPDQLWVFTENGRLFKKLKLGAPETAINSIGIHYGFPVIQTDEGMWRGDPASWRWSPVALFGVSWSEAVAAPAQLALSTVSHLSLDQLLNDISTGRIIWRMTSSNPS